jgi:hypothetical protein
VLNEINHGSGVRFHVTEAAGAEGAKRVKQRIQTAQEKLLILVRQDTAAGPGLKYAGGALRPAIPSCICAALPFQ